MTSKTLDQKAENRFQRKCQDFVNNNVYHCLSYTIEALSGIPEYQDDIPTEVPNFSLSIENHLYNIGIDSLVEIIEDNNLDIGIDLTLVEAESYANQINCHRLNRFAECSRDDERALEGMVCHEMISQIDLESFCDENFVDMEYDEVYEYYAVSDLFATELKEQCETVFELLDFNNIWARTTTGQQISIDYCVRQIAATVSVHYK